MIPGPTGMSDTVRPPDHLRCRVSYPHRAGYTTLPICHCTAAFRSVIWCANGCLTPEAEHQMAIKLYLHIGHIHASSDHVRVLLAANRAALLARGYGIADAKLQLDGEPGSAAFFERALQADTPDIAAYDAAFGALAASAKSKGLKAVIVSAPNLAVPGGAALVAGLRAHFEVRVLYYFKRQEHLVVDWWLAGAFKTGIGLNAYIDEIIERHPRRHYRDALEEFLNTFGAEAMRVQLLWFKVLKGECLERDLWYALDLEPDDFEVVPEPAPLVSSYLATALKESPYLFADEDDQELIDFIRSYAAGEPKHKINPLDVAPRRRIMEHFQPENRWIKVTFFADVEMAGWNAVPDSDDRSYDVTLSGITEAINVNLSMLKDLREDVARIKRRMGLK